MADNVSSETDKYDEVKRYLADQFPGSEVDHSEHGFDFMRDTVAFRIRTGHDIYGFSILNDILDDAYDPGGTTESKRTGIRNLLHGLRLAERLRNEQKWLLVMYAPGSSGVMIQTDPLNRLP